ncbi:MAG TPA: hypothetical protein DCF33_22565 [Saprospirales bacterium]|nr:hypothetical protein [Saprospirales bacterium]
MQILVSSGAETPLFESAVIRINTSPQKEPIEVSPGLYAKLESWFAREDNTIPFCIYINELDLHPYEKLAFLQAYSFNNTNFVKPANTSGGVLSSWFPPTVQTGSNAADWCMPPTGNCHCKVITKGLNIADPNDGLNNFTVSPVKRKTSQRYRLYAGAAKYVGLYQDRTGGQTLQLSNIQDFDDAASVTTEASEIAFLLGCLGGSNALPEDCQCERPLHLYYEYTTHLHARANLRNCPWTKGAEATAEDLAFIGIYEGKTGNLTAIDAGRSKQSANCNNTWNPQWFVNLTKMAKPVADYFISRLDTSSNRVPSQAQFNLFFSALEVLINTQSHFKNGECGTKQKEQVLISGSNTYALKPNSPIRASLFSAYYAYTRGYGCWKAQAGIAIDYYLLGAVESQLTEDPECCSDKYANYVAGSLSSPDDARFELDAVNSIQNRLGRVGFFMAFFGSWDGLDPIPGAGIISLTREFDNKIYGPSCDGDGLEIPNEDRNTLQLTDNETLSIYPNPAKDQLYIDLLLQKEAFTEVQLVNLATGLSETLQSGHQKAGPVSLQVSIQDRPTGPYLLRCWVNDAWLTFKIFIL